MSVDRTGAYDRLDNWLDEYYHPGARDDLRDVCDGGGNLIIERAYWHDPVQVFAGITWLIVGGGVGFLIGYFA